MCLASRKDALRIRRVAFHNSDPESRVGHKVAARIIAVDRTHLTAESCGYDLAMTQRDLTYAMTPDLREKFHPGEVYAAILKEYKGDAPIPVAISIKEVEPHPFIGADARHPIGAYRTCKITGKFAGGVFCQLEDELVCLCTYSARQYDDDFKIGDTVSVVIIQHNYSRQQVYGKIISR